MHSKCAPNRLRQMPKKADQCARNWLYSTQEASNSGGIRDGRQAVDVGIIAISHLKSNDDAVVMRKQTAYSRYTFAALRWFAAGLVLTVIAAWAVALKSPAAG